MLTEAFQPQALSEMRITYREAELPFASAEDRRAQVYSEAEVEDVEERLRGLGYL